MVLLAELYAQRLRTITNNAGFVQYLAASP